METRACPVCRRGLDPRRADARYCSAACRQRAYRLRRRTWSGDAGGNVWVDGRWVGRISPPPHVEWTGGGIEAATVRDAFPAHRVAGAPAMGLLRSAAARLEDMIAFQRLDPEGPDAAELRAAARELRRRAREAGARAMNRPAGRRARPAGANG